MSGESRREGRIDPVPRVRPQLYAPERSNRNRGAEHGEPGRALAHGATRS